MTDGVASFQYTTAESGAGRLELSGQLDAATLAGPWQKIVGPIRSAPPSELEIDLAGVTYCDGAGIGLLIELDREVRGRGGAVRFENLKEDLRGLLDQSLLQDPATSLKPSGRRTNAISELGRSTALILDDIRSIITFTGELTLVLPWALTHPHRVRWGDTLRIAEKTGANATYVVSLLGFLVGLIIAFQCAGPMRTLGAEALVPTVVAVAIIRELGPLMAAIILAGRSGSAFAAEIGTMKVTEEINALETFGLSPTRFLVVPRVLASLFVTPLLSVFSTLMGLIGGYVVMAMLGYSLPFYVDQVTGAVDYVDFLQGVAKAFVFAVLVAGIGCLRGLRTQSGPGAVGDSTTRAVVAGIVLIVIADAVLGTCFYYLGI
jgi:phospholipid/cholesterol/gamma-HCH transport system permease protein